MSETQTSKTLVYGEEEIERIIDAEGSTITSSQSFVAGEPVKPIKRRIKQRIRVTTEREENEHYIRWSRLVAEDSQKKVRTMLDPEFRIEHTALGDQKGYYYVVICHTRIER